MFKFVVILSIVATLYLISNTNGLFFSHIEKCHVALYKGGKDFSGEKIMANKTFVPFLKTIGGVAKACKVRVHVLESYKQLKTPTEYVLSSQLPLALGHAIRFTLESPKGSVVCNNLCLTAKSWKTIPEASCFINNVQTKGIKFTEPNLLHDGYAAKLSTSEAEALKVHTQKLCAPKVKPAKKG